MVSRARFSLAWRGALCQKLAAAHTQIGQQLIEVGGEAIEVV
jgi:hypothetical protein